MQISKLLTASILGVSIFSSTSFAAPVTAQEEISITKELARHGDAVQPIGETNDAYAKYFTGQSYLANLSTEKIFRSST